jgi:hypothetical protein
MATKPNPRKIDPIDGIENLIADIAETIEIIDGRIMDGSDTHQEEVDTLDYLAEYLPDLTTMIETLNDHLVKCGPDRLQAECPDLIERLPDLADQAKEVADGADRQAQGLFWDEHSDEDEESVEAVNDAVDCLTAAITALRGCIESIEAV